MTLAIKTIARLNRWDAASIAADIHIEFSPRLTTSLGLSYPERRLIRLNQSLLGVDADLLDLTLCHELAHVVVHARHGRSAAPHGLQWRALMKSAGFTPSPTIAGKRTAPTQMSRRYRHACSVCSATRFARRAMSNWRCGACTKLGLPGELSIEIAS